MNTARVNRRLRILAWVHIVFGGLGVGAGLLLITALLMANDPAYYTIAGSLAAILMGLSVVYFIPSLIGGIGLLKGWTWARAVLWMESALLVLAVPVGTALAGLALWALLTTRGEVQTSADGGILKFEAWMRRAIRPIVLALIAIGILGTMLGIGWLFRDSFDNTRHDVKVIPLPSGVPPKLDPPPEFKMPALPDVPGR